MDFVSDTSCIFTRYDLQTETDHGSARRISDDILLQKVADCLIDGNEQKMLKVIAKTLKTKHPLDVINKGLLPGMQEVGRRWSEGEYFLPQVIISSDTMLAGITICEEELGQTMKKKGQGGNAHR